MFEFRLETDISLLTVIRTGNWSLSTVILYEAALRRELVKLQLCDSPTLFIIDIRSSGPQPPKVAEALRSMVAGLGHLHADRTAVVTATGLSKLEAKQITDKSGKVFTSMVLARDWITGKASPTPAY